MKTVFPLLMIGDQTEAYNVLNTGLFSDVKAVMDLTKDLPTRKWLRKDSEVILKKTTKIDKALEFIHEQRKLNRAVMVVGENAVKCCATYIVLRKDVKAEEAYKMCGSTIEDEFPVMAKYVAERIGG